MTLRAWPRPKGWNHGPRGQGYSKRGEPRATKDYIMQFFQLDFGLMRWWDKILNFDFSLKWIETFVCGIDMTLRASMQTMMERIMTFLKYPHLNPQNLYVYVTLCGRRDFADMIKLRILKCWYYLRFSERANDKNKYLYKRGRQVRGRKRSYVNGTSGWSDVLYRWTGPWAKEDKQPLQVERQTNSPLNSSERMLPDQCLILNFWLPELWE